MKKDIVILVTLILAFGFVAFLLGKSQGIEQIKMTNSQIENRIKDSISQRYTQVFGSPATQEQQCEMDFIIYDDVTECQP